MAKIYRTHRVTHKSYSIAVQQEYHRLLLPKVVSLFEALTIGGKIGCMHQVSISMDCKTTTNNADVCDCELHERCQEGIEATCERFAIKGRQGAKGVFPSKGKRCCHSHITKTRNELKTLVFSTAIFLKNGMPPSALSSSQFSSFFPSSFFYQCILHFGFMHLPLLWDVVDGSEDC